MPLNKFNLSNVYFLFLIVICAIVIVDFALPTAPITSTVSKITTNQERYYNAANGGHFSYTLETASYSIPISKEFKDLITKEDRINIYRSIVLKEINAVEHIASGRKEIYSLRWFSGMVIPLTAMILFGMRIYGVKRIKTVLLIAQILFIANLAMLIYKSLWIN